MAENHEPARVHGGDVDPEDFGDAGARQLAAALRTSFRLLALLMVFGVAAFLAMGFQSVRPGEVAIRTVFGHVVGTTTEGLAYNWPAPIGRIEKIPVGERTITVDDFWMNETRKDQLEPNLRKRKAPRGGLRPGWDGALLTGDRNLLHMRLRCTYALSRQWDPAREIDPVLRYRENVSDANEFLRSALCGSAIRAAAIRTADGLQRTDRAAFESDVRALAQRSLRQLRSGIQVRTVKVVNSTWPLRTLTDYDAAQQAVNEAETLRNNARSVAVALLNSTAGPVAARLLVGDPAKVIAAGRETVSPGAGTRPAGDDDLVGRYNDALRRGDKTRAGELLRLVENVLVSDATEGQVRRVLREARSYRAGTIQGVKSRVAHFKKNLPAYRRNPAFMLDRWWMETREAILGQATAEKHYIPPGGPKTVLRISRDPEIIRQTDRARMRAGTGQKPAGD